MSNILFIKGKARYNAMRNYLDEIEEGFRNKGFNTCMLDALDESVWFQMKQLHNSKKIDIVFTCNVVGIECKKLFTDAVYITYICDHPEYHRERLSHLDGNDMVFTCDKKYEKYLKQYFLNIKYVKYIPLSGSYSKKYIPYKKRTRDIIFTGTFFEKNDYVRKFQGVLDKFSNYMMQSIIRSPEQSLEECLSAALDYYKVNVSDQEFCELMGEFLYIDKYARSYYRDYVIRLLLENNLTVHVYGEGWDKFEGKGKENLIIEKGDYYLAQKAVSDAKIAINIMPWFKDGFQERIATAMLSGTVAITDESLFIKKNFEDGKELVIYSLEKVHELPQRIKWLLEHPDTAEKIADTGRKRALESLTWQHRVIEMVDYIEKSLGILGNGLCGEIILIPYQILHHREYAKDVVKHIYSLLDMMDQVQLFDKMEIYDVNYFFLKFIFIFLNARSNFPELCLSKFSHEFLLNLADGQEAAGAELLSRECSSILCSLLDLENKQLTKEIQCLQYQMQNINAKPNEYCQKMIVKKIIQNYQESKDEIIQEILNNIRKNNYVGPYNQNFVLNHQGLTKKEMSQIRYDSQAEMYYGIWNGKKMYYPRGYSVEMVVEAINFVKLEQDTDSPHRYLNDQFMVEEGDIVIDAGVAEGNFALDIIDNAKKIYLVECEPKWIEALRKTFEPWTDKVIIIEKMLSDKNDDQYVSIDGFVEEGYVNFIKMDVEGAEVPSLMGASSILRNSKNIKCAICTYHRKNAENDIRKILEEQSFYTMTTRGYIFFGEDMDSWIDGELRHGLIRAVKKC